MIGPERRLRLAIGPTNALLVDRVAPSQDRPGDTGQDILIHIALHRRAHIGEITRLGAHIDPPQDEVAAI